MIEVHGLTRYYGDFAALQDVSFHVDEGTIVGLLGRNGAGKSTTLKILAGLIPPSEGTVTMDGVDLVADPNALRSRIGYLPEDPPLYTDMRVKDFVAHIGRLKGMSAAQVEARLPDVLDKAQLTDRAEQVIGTLSHGYRKRVGIAQAIIHDPRLVILDEPISGLDPVQIVEMRGVIRNLAEGRAVILSSHILREIEQTCDRLVVLRDGQLVAQGTEEELTQGLHQTKLRIAALDPDQRFADWLHDHPLVAKVEESLHDGRTTTCTARLHHDERDRLVADLVGEGFGLRRLEESLDALEEAFLDLAGGTTP